MRILMLISVVCFVIALLGKLGTFNGVDVIAWALGGLLAWAADVALAGVPLAFPVAQRRAPPPQ
jgi:hypothetical protein